MTDVGTPSAAYTMQVPDWHLATSLIDGTRAMRAAGKLYLPQEPKETVEAYQVRVERSFLFNGYERTISGLTGKVFDVPVELKNEGPWKDYAQNIDLAGNNLNVFARNLFGAGIGLGGAAVLVEFPRTDGITNLAQERAAGVRPYFCPRPMQDVIGWRTESVGGKERLVRLRIRERVPAYLNPWDDDTMVDQVRVLEPGMFEVWRRDVRSNQWFIVEAGRTNLGFIPVAFFLPRPTGLATGKLPLLDLAWTNVSHWQSSSDQRNILHIARVPMLFMAGVNPDDLGGGVEIGPSRMMAVANPQASAKYIEHTGQAIAAGRDDIKDLEERMALYGAEVLVKRTGTQTATGKALDTAQADSTLAQWAMGLEDALNTALAMGDAYTNGGALRQLGQDYGAACVVNRDYNIIGSTADLDALQKARAAGDISREAFIAELKRRGVLMVDFDAEADAVLLDKEATADLARTVETTAALVDVGGGPKPGGFPRAA